MIRSKSVSICNHSRAKLVDSSRNRTFHGGTQIWCARTEDSLNLGSQTLRHRWNLRLMSNISYVQVESAPRLKRNGLILTISPKFQVCPYIPPADEGVVPNCVFLEDNFPTRRKFWERGNYSPPLATTPGKKMDRRSPHIKSAPALTSVTNYEKDGKGNRGNGHNAKIGKRFMFNHPTVAIFTPIWYRWGHLWLRSFLHTYRGITYENYCA